MWRDSLTMQCALGSDDTQDACERQLYWLVMSATHHNILVMITMYHRHGYRMRQMYAMAGHRQYRPPSTLVGSWSLDPGVGKPGEPTGAMSTISNGCHPSRPKSRHRAVSTPSDHVFPTTCAQWPSSQRIAARMVSSRATSRCCRPGTDRAYSIHCPHPLERRRVRHVLYDRRCESPATSRPADWRFRADPNPAGGFGS